MSKARSRARRVAMQGLYEWQVGGNAPGDIYRTYLKEHDLSKVDADYFRELMLEVPRLQEEIDASLTPHVSRPLHEIDPIELAVLRLAAYELLHRIDVPYRVVINEAVELAKTFGAEAGHKFINGILDKAAADLRALEVQRKR